MNATSVCPWCKRVQMAGTNLWEPLSAEQLVNTGAGAGQTPLPDAICPECTALVLQPFEQDGVTLQRLAVRNGSAP